MTDPPVIWGGSLRDPEEVLERVLDAIDEDGQPVISVRWADAKPDESQEQYLERVAREGRLPHGKIQTTSRGTLIARGFDFIEDASEDQPPHHYHVIFPQVPELADAEKFVSAFSEPFPNPGKTNRIHA